MKPMKKRMLQDHTIQDALAFWQLLRRGRFRPLLAEPTENTIIQLFRYVITGASSFLVDFLLLFLLELAGLYYLPASAVSFLVGISCNFLLTKFFAFKSVDPTVGPTAEVFVFAAISGGGLVLTMVLMYLFTSRLQLYFMVSKLISSILVFFWNFLGRKFILYPERSTNMPDPSNKERDLPWEIPFFVASNYFVPLQLSPVQDCLPGGSMAQPEGRPAGASFHRWSSTGVSG